MTAFHGGGQMSQDDVFTGQDSLRAKIVELQELQAKYESMVEAFDGLIYICSTDYKVEFMNRRFIERTGRNAVGENCFEALHDRESICPWCVNDRVFQGETVRWEVLSPLDQHWYYVVNTPILHPDGSVSKMGMILDISERKRAEEELREMEMKLRTLLDNIPDFIARFDRTLRHMYVNPAASKVFGIAPENFVGKTPAELAPPGEDAQHQLFENMIERAFAEGITNGVGAHFMTADGVRFFDILNVPERGESGQVDSVVSIARDVTERKQAEERLRLFDFALDHMREAAFLIDANARFRFVNEESCRILGYTRSELLGLGVPDVDPDFPMERWPSHWEDLKTHGSLLFEGRHQAKDGHVVPVEISANYFEYEGQAFNLALVRDITKRKQAEQEHLANLRFFESMDRVNRAIQGTNDLERMMSDVLDTVLSVFDCDRAFLMYPCDPKAASWTAPMERTKPEYPGMLASRFEMPMDEEVAETLRILLNSEGPVIFGPETGHELPEYVAETFGIKSFMSMALHPKVDKPWQFGIHQCTYPRVWTEEEERLFQEIGRRLEDGLSAMLAYRNLLDNIGKLEEAQRIGHVGYWDRDIAGGQVTLADEACRIFGISEHESVFDLEQWHERWLTLLHPEDQQRANQAYVEALEGGPRYNIEYRIVRPGGEVRHVHSEANVTRDESGNATRVLGMMQDITERKQAEEAVRRANKDWKQTFDAIPDMVTVLDTQHRILRANKATVDSLGITERELIGQHCYELFHGEQSPPVFCPHSQLLADGKEHSAELVEPRLGGTYEVRVSPWGDENVRVTGSVHVTRDITALKQSEKQLRQSNDLLRAIIEAAPTAIIGLDLDGNVQLVWNPAAEKMLGWSHQEVMGRPLPSVSAEQREQFKSFRERIRRGETLDGIEVRRQRRDGTPIDYSIYASPLHDPERRITGNVAVLVDMTDRKRAEQALRASEEKYRTLFEESIDGVYFILRDGQLTDANKAFCDVFGYTRKEMIGKNVLEMYVNPADQQRFQNEIEQSGFVKDYEVKFKKRDGKEIDCLISSSVHYGTDGSVMGYRGILRDLTLQKALQAQLLQAQKMESIGTLAGGIAHDFNNLLQVIIGYSDMLLFNKKPSDSDPEYSGLRAIHRAGKDGAELAKRILAFSRRLEPKVRPVNLNNEITRVQQMLNRTVSKMIRIEIFLAGNLMTVNADPGQIEQILLNLAVNAQHAMPDGGRLTIETANVNLDEDYSRTHLDVEPGRYVLLSFSDNGHGMYKEVLEHIFEPFYTTKEAEEGTGLGLAMVFGIVKSHKGHIICYSEPGAGTTFKIYLLAIDQEIEQDVSVIQQMPAFGTETILLVDDEKPVRGVGEQMLRMAGYTVLTATNGREALEIYRSDKDKIDLVLLDLIMPEMGGKQCLEELFKINKRVKVVIASGYSANGPTKDALASGAKAFVDKPFDMRQVLKAVREVLDTE
jgi:PAS domain S-box-containing protein